MGAEVEGESILYWEECCRQWCVCVCLHLLVIGRGRERGGECPILALMTELSACHKEARGLSRR